jgi:hypothetical protein
MTGDDHGPERQHSHNSTRYYGTVHLQIGDASLPCERLFHDEEADGTGSEDDCENFRSVALFGVLRKVRRSARLTRRSLNRALQRFAALGRHEGSTCTEDGDEGDGEQVALTPVGAKRNREHTDGC